MPEAIETAYVAVRPDTRGFARDVRRQVGNQLNQPIAAAPAKLGRTIVGATAAVTGITLGIQGVFSAINAGFDELQEAETVLASTNAIIKSTGGVANVTAKEVLGLAETLSQLSGVDDEVVANGENIILTFKNVRNEVGKGNDIFNRTTRAALDLSKVAGGAFGTMDSASKALGKALNDPVRGMTALGRAGVTFTQGQKDTVKALVESGRLLDAQKLILVEVESQVGGNAAAFGQTLPGALGRLRNSFNELLADGLFPLQDNLAAGANQLADFFTQMKDGNEASQDIADAFQAAKNAVAPLFDAIADEGPRIKSIFEDLRDIVRQALPALKVLGAIIGITIVVAFKVAIRIVERFVQIWKLTARVIVEAVQLIIHVIDGLLGALSAAADAASHLPFIGDEFAGVADAINGAREQLRDFSSELDGVDGRQVNVDVVLTTREKAAHDAGIGRAATGGGSTTPTPGAGAGGGTEVGPRANRENILQQRAAVARETQETLADDRATLQALINFYAESVRIAKSRGLAGRKFLTEQLRAQNELNSINAGVAEAGRQAAEDARSNAAERSENALAEREATLQANIRIAAATKGIIRDDRIAYRAYIGFLRERVTAARKAGIGIRAAQADLKSARQELADINRDFREAQLAEREDLLKDNVTLAGFTKRTSDDEKALKELIAFYRKRSRDMKLSKAERRKYKIALEETKRDLRDLFEREGDFSKSAQQGTTAFELLQQNASRFAEIAGNLINRNQPFKEASDFTAVQAELLTRQAARQPTAMTQQKTDTSKAIDRLIQALDRNTNARGGKDQEKGTGGKPRHKSGAVDLVPNDLRWNEAALQRARVNGSI